MAGAAGTAAVGVNTVHLPARESKASGGQPGGRRDESLAGGRRGPWRSPAASRKDRPSLGEPERSPQRVLELSPSMVSVRRDLGRAGVFGASEWCRGLGDLWVRCGECVSYGSRVAACHDLQDLVSAGGVCARKILYRVRVILNYLIDLPTCSSPRRVSNHSAAHTRGRVTRNNSKFLCGPACGCA